MNTTNLTLEQANTLLSKLGLTVEVVADAEQATPDADIEAISLEFKKPIETGITKEDVSRKVAEAAGRIHGEYRSAFGSAFGLVTNDLKDLEVKELAAKVKETNSSRYSAKEVELSGQIEELSRQINAKDEEWQNKYNELDTMHTKKYQERNVIDGFSSVLSKIPKKGDTARQAAILKAELEGKYDVRFNEDTKQNEFFVKGTNDLVMDGNNPLSTDKVAKEFVTSMGWEVTDTSNIPPAAVPASGQGADFKAGVIGMGVPQAKVAENNPFAGLINDLSQNS